MFKVFSSVVRLSGLFFVRISQEQTGGVASFGESGPSRALGISGSFGGFFFSSPRSHFRKYIGYVARLTRGGEEWRNILLG